MLMCRAATKCISKTHGYESTLSAVDISLERFGMGTRRCRYIGRGRALTGVWIDYVDLYLIHDPFKGKELRLQTYRALLEAQKAGKIRTVGVSNL